MRRSFACVVVALSASEERSSSKQANERDKNSNCLKEQ